MTNTNPAAGGATAARATNADLEARVAALSALMKSLLTALMLRGLLTRPEIAPLVAEAEALMAGGAVPAGTAELRSVQQELPSYLREAMGPPPEEGEHDH